MSVLEANRSSSHPRNDGDSSTPTVVNGAVSGRGQRKQASDITRRRLSSNAIQAGHSLPGNTVPPSSRHSSGLVATRDTVTLSRSTVSTESSVDGGGGGRLSQAGVRCQGSIDDRWGSSSTRDGCDQAAVVCVCGDDAVQLRVRKEGPNTGRLFYKCRRTPGCGFFLWGEDGGTESSTPPPPPPLFSSSNRSSLAAAERLGEGSDVVLCICGQSAKRLTVLKEGPNTGREFFACSKPRSESCGFFQWVDNDREGGEPFPVTLDTCCGVGGRGDVVAMVGGTGPAVAKRSAPSASVARTTTVRRARRCGLCGANGHMRNRCPHRDD